MAFIQFDLNNGVTEALYLVMVGSGPEAHKAARDRTDYRVFSVDEVIRLLEVKFETVTAAKEVFPGATVERVRDAGKIADDSIPF